MDEKRSGKKGVGIRRRKNKKRRYAVFVLKIDMDRKIKRKDKKKDKAEEMDCGVGKEIVLEQAALCLRKAELTD